MAAGEGLKKPATVKASASTNKDKQIKHGEIQPTDLRSWDGDILYVKNNTNEIFSWDDLKGNVMTLRGNNTDEYISVLPIEIARLPGTQRDWRRGKITVSTDPELEDELILAETAQDKKELEEMDSKFKFKFVPGSAGEIYSGPAETFVV